MTKAGVNGASAWIAAYVTSNIINGNPDVVKEIQGAQVSARYRSRTKDFKIVAKTNNIGTLELIVKKSSTGNYTIRQADYYNHQKTTFPLVP